MLENLRKLREDVAISQKQLAEAIGVSQQSINKYENHNIEPDIETLICIADFFDTSVDYLIGHTTIRRKIEEVSAYELNAEESDIIDGFRKLTVGQRQCVATVIASYGD
ncbi:MAG: helix-turn-helix transcriptional regulator [Oscillospiraceae bacterium]|nr:helix-turn-helix transcriptional regulator [Oscillospiraceae bacterium]